MKTLQNLILLFMVLFFTNCTKQVAGPKGDEGSPGTVGNLKQSVVGPVNVNSSSWSFKNNQYEFLLFAEAITAEVLKKGEVKVYLEKDSQWWTLPYSGETYIFYQYSIEQGFARILCRHAHGGTPPRPKDANYRMVIFSPAK